MWELQEKIKQMVNQYLEDSGVQRVGAEEIGLDSRAGYVFVSVEEGWIASENTSSLEYYGGFEYIGGDYKETIGEITFYSEEHSRVERALEYYNNNQGE